MANENQKATEQTSWRGGGGGRCCGGPGTWIWIILVVGIVVVLIAKSAGPKKETGQAKEKASQTVEAASPPVAGAGVQATAGEPAKGVAIPRLVDLGAGKCIPCKMMAPILEDLKKTYAGKLDVVFIDVWQNPDEGRKYNIHLIPTQIFYDASGKELFRHEGFFSKEDILAKWKELGVDLGATGAPK